MGLGLLLLTLTLVARLKLTGMAVDSALRSAGASDITFNVSQASPWEVVVDDVGFQVKSQAFAAKQVVFSRAHWWTPSLGAVRVAQARMPLKVDGDNLNPSAWFFSKNGSAAIQSRGIPAEEISVDGQLVIQAAALSEQAITLRIKARQSDKGTWIGELEIEGSGLAMKAEGAFAPASSQFDFKIPTVSLDLKIWQGFIQSLVVLPGGTLDLAGQLTGSAEGKLVGGKVTSHGVVRLRNGRVKNEVRAIAADGIEADFEFADFGKFLTKPGTVRVRELRAGQLAITEIEAEAAMEGPEKIVVPRASLKALGGSVAAEPFKYFTNLRELDAVLLVDGVSVAEVMALTKDLPARASGRVDGRLPVHIDDSGLRFGTGWLELKPGVYAEVQFDALGLLTGGIPTNHPSYAMLKKIESGLLKLKIGAMRLDIRPPNAPPGRSAQLHLQGEPVDREVKAPISLDLNVNGPLEKLINLGLDSRLSFGTKP